MFHFWFHAMLVEFLMVRWRVEQGTRQHSKGGRELLRFLCDVCCENAEVSPEERQTAQYESTLKSLVSLARTGHYF